MKKINSEENQKKYAKWHKLNVIFSICNGILYLTYFIYVLIREFTYLKSYTVFCTAFNYVLIGLWMSVLVVYFLSAIKVHICNKIAFENYEEQNERRFEQSDGED